MITFRNVIRWWNSTFRGIVYADDSLPEDPLQIPEEIQLNRFYIETQSGEIHRVHPNRKNKEKY